MNNYRMILSANHTAEFGYKENGNILVLGQVGTYKTRGHVLPNIMEQDNISMVIADTKGELRAKTEKLLRSKGYVIKAVNFDRPEFTMDYFNPFAYIHTPEDILATSAILASEVRGDCHIEPYWDNAAMLLLNTVIAYLVEEVNPEERTLESIQKLVSLFRASESRAKSALEILFDDLREKNSASFAVKQFDAFNVLSGSEKTSSCVVSTLLTKFAQFLTPAIERLTGKDTLNFDAIGKTKTALFVSVSDVDRSKDKLVSIFYNLLLNRLRNVADDQTCGCLPIHTHFFLDDFATNVVIPNFANYISCLRSREISFTIILQSEAQLESRYGKADSHTIISNCAYYLFLGSQDVETCSEVAKRLNYPLNKVLEKPRNEMYILGNFRRPIADAVYDVCTHPCYDKLTNERYYPENDFEDDFTDGR